MIPRAMLATLILLPPSCVQPLWAQDISWVRQIGTESYDTIGGIAVAGSAIYVVGTTDGVLPGQSSAGSSDLFLRKLDQAGNTIWTRQFGTSAAEFREAVAAFGKLVFVAGSTRGSFNGPSNEGRYDMFVRCYDEDGNASWTAQLGTAGLEYVLGVAADATGIYVLGRTDGAFTDYGQASVGGYDAFLAKLDGGGNPVWVRQFGTAGFDMAGGGGVAADDSGVYVTGSVEFSLPGQTTAGQADGFLRKYYRDGNVIWTRQFGTACGDYSYAVSVHSSGVYVTGDTGGDFGNPEQCPPLTSGGLTNNGYVRKFDLSGMHVWTRHVRPFTHSFGKADIPFAIAVDDRGVFIGGMDNGTLPGQTRRGSNADRATCSRTGFFESTDAYVRAYSLEGDVLWTRQIGGAREDVIHAIGVGGGAVFAGVTSSCELPDAESFGLNDGYLIKLTEAPSSLEGSIQLLVGRVETLLGKSVSNAGNADALNAKLASAADQLVRGNTSAAKGQLGAFVNMVEMLQRNGSLAPAQAQPLIAAAGLIIAAL